MFRFLAVAFALLSHTVYAAQITNPDSYTYPILDVARLYSASFGEMRPNHYHSGIDIKSDGTSGKRIVAAAKGYVSRISLSPYGYGLAIYVAHPTTGTTTVYAHLSRGREDIQEYIESERYRLRQHSVNLFLTPSQFPVEQGDLIAYSGNSGASSAPHLHFEVRQTSNQKTLNPVTLGIIKPIDKISPIITKLYYVECQSVDGVCYEKGLSNIEISRNEDGSYQIKDNKPLWVGREGYFILSVTDRKDGVVNTFGIYDLRGKRDGVSFYHYQQNGFLFSDTRYCNAVSYYPLQKGTSVESYRLKKLEGLPSSILKSTKDDGVIRTVAGEQSEITIKATDHLGNSSTLSFTIKGKDDKDSFRAEVDSEARIIRPKESYIFSDEKITVKIPEGCLYEAIPYELKISDTLPQLPESTTGVNIYSKEYRVMCYDTPLHRAIELSIEAEIPTEELSQIFMGYVTEKGDFAPLAAKYKEGRFTASSRVTGGFFVATDIEAPEVTANFKEGADLTKSKFFSFNIKDNFSGVSSFTAKIDGEWVALDLNKTKLIHTFRAPADGKIHTVEITVSDLCGNETTLSRSFKR